jgi:integrase
MADGKGLYLEVDPSRGKYWRFKFRFPKEKRISLGVYPEVSLAAAREALDECRKLLAKDIDPGLQRKAIKSARAGRAIDSFEVIAREWLKKFIDPRAESHRKRVYARFENDVFPKIGKRPISEITRDELLEVILKIENRGAGDTAHRTLGSCSQVFRYAIRTGRCEHNICGDLQGALAPVVEHHFAAVTTPKEMLGLLRAIDGYKGTFVVQRALQLAPLVFVRPGELRNAKWKNFDLDEAEWCLKLSKQRDDRPSVPGADDCIIVPLSAQALNILLDINSLTGGGEYVFPGYNDKHRPMSENAVLMALRRVGIPKEEMCGQGFRAAARTILRQELHIEPENIEHQLGHQVIDPNGRAYNRATHLPERRLMLQAWADYLDRLKSGEKIEPTKAKRLTDIKLIQVAGYR